MKNLLLVGMLVVCAFAKAVPTTFPSLNHDLPIQYGIPHSADWHKYYVSVTQMDYNDESNTLQIVSRLFIDDMESCFKEWYDKDIKLDGNEDADYVDSLLKRYFTSRVTVWSAGEELKLNYIGYKVEDDQYKVYVETEKFDNTQSITVSNQLLTEMFSGQQNLVHIHVRDKRSSLLLTRENSKGTLNF